jgi:transcriptional regulator with XRE-family HTH domain
MIRPDDRKDLVKLGKRVLRLRQNKNLAQRTLSYISDIDNSKISKIERGMINISYTTIKRLAIALEITQSQLIDLNDITIFEQSDNSNKTNP